MRLSTLISRPWNSELLLLEQVLPDGLGDHLAGPLADADLIADALADPQRLRDSVEGDALLPVCRVDGDHDEVLVQVTAGHIREVAA